MKDKYDFINIERKIVDSDIEKIRQYIKNNPNKKVCINIKNTTYINKNILKRLHDMTNSNLYIRVEGAYDSERIKNYPHHQDFHTYDNIYTLDELYQILKNISKIEEGIRPNWSEEEKLIYIINFLKNKIIYHPFHETEESKEIRSLRGLISGRTVCAGYALILKEFCDRNGIKCQYVEGACKKSDYEGGHLTHAWNIVKLNGYNVPIDLTWNAGEHNKGNDLSFEDIANVNEFVKCHFPGKYEKIQDYRKNLMSIDGEYLKKLDSIVNRTYEYDINRKDVFVRKNNTRFILKQISEHIHDGKQIYKYIYCDLDSNNNIINQKMLFSSTNINYIRNLALKKKKMENNLNRIYRHLTRSEYDKEKGKIRHLRWVDESYSYVKDVLFSKSNINAATQRGDFYVGKLDIEYKNGSSNINRVLIDTNFSRDINSKQKTITRSDDSMFVLEDYGIISLDNRKKVFRYRIYEFDKKEKKLKKNTIFTDKDIMNDNRKGIANDFLNRSRLDRKQVETAGYLGYYSDNNIRTYDPDTNNYFTHRLYDRIRINESKFKPYFEPINFSEMKRLVKYFKYDKDKDGNSIIVNRYTKEPVKDKNIEIRAKFALIWLQSAGVKINFGEEIEGFDYAYNSSAEEVFNNVCHYITSSIKSNGNIKSLKILDKISRESDYKYAEDIVINLFNNPKKLEIIENLFILQNPSLIKRNKEYEVLSYSRAYYREQLEKMKQKLIEVVPSNNEVVIRKI